MNKIKPFINLGFLTAYYFICSCTISFGQSNSITYKLNQFEDFVSSEEYDEATIIITEIIDRYQKNGKWDSLIIYNEKLSDLGKKSGNLAQEIQGKLDVINIKKFFGGYRSAQFEESLAAYNLLDTTRLTDDFISGLLQGKANLYFNQNILDTAVHIGNAAIRFADKSKNTTQMALSRLTTSKILQFNNRYDAAIQNLVEAESIVANDYIDEITQIRVYQNIGNLCTKIEDFEKAEKYLLKSKKIAEDKNYKTFVTDSELYLARLYKHQKKYDKSLTLINNVLEYYEQKNLKIRIKDALSDKAYIYASLKQHNRFDKTIKRILEISNILDVELKVLVAFNALERNNLTKVEKTLAEFKNKNNQKAKFARSLKKLEYKYYEKINKSKIALEKFKEYKSIEDSIYQSNQAIKAVRIESEFNRKKQDSEIKALSSLTVAQDKALSIRNTALILGSIMLLILGALLFFLYRLYIKNQENQKELARQNKLISEALSQNQILIKEIHHRVKNNLQVISSLLSMQERKVKDVGTKDALKSSKSRVQSMSILHQNLYTGENLKDINVDDYMNKLVQNIIDTYNLNKDIQFKINIDPIALDVDTLVPLGLISNELICNALKHAFVGKDNGQLDVSLKSKEDKIILQVADNGIGFEGDQLPNKEGSLGTRLIHSFTQRLDGKIEINQTSGTAISIIFDKSKLFL